MSICDVYLSDKNREWKTLCENHHFRIAEYWPTLTFEELKTQLGYLQSGAWLVSVEFELSTPFYSKSEDSLPLVEENRIVENFPHTDSFTGEIEVKPSTWKGNLLLAARQQKTADDWTRIMFGETDLSGTLFFFPTFFSRREMVSDVITSLSRISGTPQYGPIAQKCIKEGSCGEFLLLFSPHHNMDTKLFADCIRRTLDAVKAMLLETGFSARRTKGWGRAKENLTARIAMKGYSISKADKRLEYGDFLDETGELLKVFSKKRGKPINENVFTERKNEGIIPDDVTRTQYSKFRKWYKNRGDKSDAADITEGLFSIESSNFNKIRSIIERIEYVGNK